ncbi:MAG: hypothetical protein R3F39_02980 [Myxococcota bacterium]
MQDHVEALATVLSKVRLGLEATADGFVVTYEKERHALADLPILGLTEADARGELMAVAAGLEAAIKYPGRAANEDFATGATTLLPKVESRRFVDAYAAVLAGRGAPESEQLMSRDFGAGLVVLYVRDEGWKFSHITKGQHARWAVTPGTVDAGARSHLYHRAELDWHDPMVALGDGYDAARAVIVGDVFYHLGQDGGVPVAIPDRDHLLVGPAADASATAELYAASRYPICPHPLVFRGDRVERR